MQSARIARSLATTPAASVPGAYAWAVTVIPCVWGRANAPWPAMVSAILAPLVLIAGSVLERRLGSRIRSPYLWAFTAFCGVVWLSTAAGGALPLDRTYRVAGALGWGVFALCWAAPPLRPWDEKPVAVIGVPKSANSFPRASLTSMALGIGVAVALQLMALDVKAPERELLLRLLSIAAALVAVGAGTKSALAYFARAREP
jgi:hypothetical protein